MTTVIIITSYITPYSIDDVDNRHNRHSGMYDISFASI